MTKESPTQEQHAAPYLNIQICIFDSSQWQIELVTPGKDWTMMMMDQPIHQGEIYHTFYGRSLKFVTFRANRALKKYQKRERRADKNAGILMDAQLQQLLKEGQS